MNPFAHLLAEDERRLSRAGCGPALATYAVEVVGYRIESLTIVTHWQGETTVERRVMTTAITRSVVVEAA